MRTKIYVAGAISNGGKLKTEEQHKNVYAAVEVGQRLIEEGYAPMVPHLSWYWEQELGLTNDWNHWLEMDEAWILAADAVLRLDNKSAGADREVAFAQEVGVPIYYSLDELLANPPGQGDERFHRKLRQMGLLHDQKQKDYGTDNDPFANVRASSDWGIPAWIGTMIRGTDKIKRMQTYAKKGSLANEGLVDSLFDLAVYSIIALILFEEEQEKKP